MSQIDGGSQIRAGSVDERALSREALEDMVGRMASGAVRYDDDSGRIIAEVAPAPRSLAAQGWTDYPLDLPPHVWVRAQNAQGDTPSLKVPDLPPARPGHRWELHLGGFLRVRVNKRGTVYVGAQIGLHGMGAVSGGKFFPEASEDLVPLRQSHPVTGGESVYFSLYSMASGGDTLTVIANPNPQALILEVAVQS